MHGGIHDEKKIKSAPYEIGAEAACMPQAKRGYHTIKECRMHNAECRMGKDGGLRIEN